MTSKPRQMLSATEVESLYEQIAWKLESACIPTQPEIAGRLLALNADPSTCMPDYANVVKADAALTGRLLRVVNSAFFAQRRPVTNLERACVLLGIERLKAVSLGFYLSRAAGTDSHQDFARRVWSESVLRACLAAELARRKAPGLGAEAFVIGLMMDAGLPLAYKLLSEAERAVLESDDPPAKVFERELAELPYTHVDVAAVLARRWKLPPLLARPIQSHHTPPTEGEPRSAVGDLHRVAYYVGALRLDARAGRKPATLRGLAESVLGMEAKAVEDAVRAATLEYEAMCTLFRDVADTLGDADTLVQRVQQQANEALDQAVISCLKIESTVTSETFRFGEEDVVEIVPEGQGKYTAYLGQGEGARLASYSLNAGDDARTVLNALYIEATSGPGFEELDQFLRSLETRAAA